MSFLKIVQTLSIKLCEADLELFFKYEQLGTNLGTY